MLNQSIMDLVFVRIIPVIENEEVKPALVVLDMHGDWTTSDSAVSTV